MVLSFVEFLAKMLCWERNCYHIGLCIHLFQTPPFISPVCLSEALCCLQWGIGTYPTIFKMDWTRFPNSTFRYNYYKKISGFSNL